MTYHWSEVRTPGKDDPDSCLRLAAVDPMCLALAKASPLEEYGA